MHKFLILSCLILLTACGEPRPPISAEEQQKIDAATAAIKAEPRVKAIIYNSLEKSMNWNIEITPAQGSERGFASYLCEVLNENGLNKDQYVEIVYNQNNIVAGIDCDTYIGWP